MENAIILTKRKKKKEKSGRINMCTVIGTEEEALETSIKEKKNAWKCMGGVE